MNSIVTVQIQDNDPPGGTTNPSDTSSSSVTQHYIDFLNRVPDAAGRAFWTNEIEQCGADGGAGFRSTEAIHETTRTNTKSC